MKLTQYTNPDGSVVGIHFGAGARIGARATVAEGASVADGETVVGPDAKVAGG